MRALMWLILAVLVIFALRKKSQRPSNAIRPEPVAPTVADRNAQAETMVCCDRCQVYIPASEAVTRGDKVYCCVAHADQA
jgi:uncharacterized protein